MTANEFVKCIRREVLERNMGLYLESLERNPAEGASHWPRMAKLYQSLNQEQQTEFVVAIRQVMVDTLSNMFGILDGSSLLDTYRDYYHLTYDRLTDELNGDLQDLFLSGEE